MANVSRAARPRNARGGDLLTSQSCLQVHARRSMIPESYEDMLVMAAGIAGRILHGTAKSQWIPEGSESPAGVARSDYTRRDKIAV